MENVRISVIVPVYNGETTLDRCVFSVLAQSHCNFELILVDDGSTDGSSQLCDGYTDQRITVIHKENGGVSSARNAGIAAASGDYVFFLDCDDELESCALERLSELAEGGYELIALSLRVEGEGENRVIGLNRDYCTSNVFEELLDRPEPFGVCGGKAVKTSFIREKGLSFDTSLYSQEDMRFFLQVYRLGESFYFSSYEGYVYYYTVSCRRPQVKDHVENQVLAILYAAQRSTDECYCINGASVRLCENIFGYLAYAPDDKGVSELLRSVREINGISEALSYGKPDGICGVFRRMFLKGNDRAVIRLMKCRRLIKRLLLRGKA